MTLRVFTAFSGYDSQLMALRNIGVDYECVGWSEIDKYAIAAHDAVFPELADRNYGDITAIDWDEVPDFDLLTYSFPCTDISRAGRQAGLAEGSETRSSLLWACTRPIRKKRPKFLLMENVKALAGEKFRGEFLKWDEWLRLRGYVNYTAVLDARDYGVPQHRERLFMLSILNGNWYEFPHPEQLRKCLADVLEDEVGEKYYLSEKRIAGMLRHNERHAAKGNGFEFRPTSGKGVARTVTTQNGIRETDNYIIQLPRGFNKGAAHDVAPTLTSSGYEHNNLLRSVQEGEVRLRKLTPRECMRLMGVSDEDFDKMRAAGLSDTQLYKLAGNSIVVDVLERIFVQMLRFENL